MANDTSLAVLGLTLVSGSSLCIFNLLQSKQSQNLPRTDKRWLLNERLSNAHSWTDLSNTLFNTIACFMPIEAGSLSVYIPFLTRYKRVAEWQPSLPAMEGAAPALTDPACADCLIGQSEALRGVSLCENETANLQDGAARDTRSYCFPLVLGRKPVAKLQLRLVGVKSPSQAQLSQLISLGNDMALAIQDMANDTLLYEETITTDSAEKLVQAERRKIAKDLHDSLGQDIAFLRMKLDQLVSTAPAQNQAAVQKDLTRMLDVANDAYQKIRGQIVAIEPTVPAGIDRLLNDLLKHVADRSGFAFSFHSNHAIRPFSQDVQHQVICIVREALNNIEKHAHARHVALDLTWQETCLLVKLRDDGLGFQPGAVYTPNHFGLTIMRERAESIEAKLTLTSTKGMGTEISLNVPLSQAVGVQPIPVESYRS